MNPSKKTLIIIYLIFVVIFAWQSATKKAAPIPPPIRFVADASSYTLPTTPKLSLINETDTSLTVDTCRDISVTANGVQKTTLPQKFCRSITVEPKTTSALFGHTKEDILEFQESFANIPEVALKFTYTQPEAGAQSEASLTIGHAGVFRLFFRTVFYDPVYNLFAALVLIFP
jgi:hypothetical protein